MRNIESDSEFVAHEPCPNCGSQDNLARYSDGHGYCFGCEHYDYGNKSSRKIERQKNTLSLLDIEYRSITSRGIDEETCRKFGYGVGSLSGQPVQVAQYRNNSGSVTAQKIRTKAKTFSILGDGRGLGLWGQHIWDANGRMVVVTEGEIDALSVSQNQGNKKD